MPNGLNHELGHLTSRKMIKSDGSIRTSPSDHADPDGTDPLSFHCQEREVIAAL